MQDTEGKDEDEPQSVIQRPEYAVSTIKPPGVSRMREGEIWWGNSSDDFPTMRMATRIIMNPMVTQTTGRLRGWKKREVECESLEGLDGGQ
jgi:hypothetical protein